MAYGVIFWRHGYNPFDFSGEIGQRWVSFHHHDAAVMLRGESRNILGSLLFVVGNHLWLAA